MTDIRSIRRAILAKDIAALKAECLAFDAGLRAARLALWLRYDPDQPRVPAGSPDGGQWTSGGGGGGFADPVGGSAEAVDGFAGDPLSSGHGGDWRTIFLGVGADGTRTETVARDDGTTIRSEYAASRAAGFDERYTVASPDGSLRSFETEGLRQTVRDELGEVLGRSEFRPDGAALEPAFLPAVPAVVGKTLELGMILYVALSARNGPDAQAVAAFNAREYASAGPASELTYVGRLSPAEVQQACPGFPNVQSITNASASHISREGLSPSQYGTKVHTEIRDRIRASEGTDPFPPGYFIAERSFLKETVEDVRHGQKDSVRIDVFERPNETTVCIYDIKTGRAGFLPGRMEELARRVRMLYGSTVRFVLTEVRPRR
jgi:hypothetical protein